MTGHSGRPWRPAPPGRELGSEIGGGIFLLVLLNIGLLLLGWIWPLLIIDAIVAFFAVMFPIILCVAFVVTKLNGSYTPYSRRPPKLSP